MPGDFILLFVTAFDPRNCPKDRASMLIREIAAVMLWEKTRKSGPVSGP